MHLQSSAQPILVPEGGVKQFIKFLLARIKPPFRTIALWPDGVAGTSGVKRAGTSPSKAIATVQSPVCLAKSVIRYYRMQTVLSLTHYAWISMGFESHCPRRGEARWRKQSPWSIWMGKPEFWGNGSGRRWRGHKRRCREESGHRRHDRYCSAVYRGRLPGKSCLAR